MVSLAGLPDLERETQIDNGCGRTISATMGAGHYAETSVPRLAPLAVRQFLINGLADAIVPADLASDYRRRMRKAGDKVTIDWVPDAGHFDRAGNPGVEGRGSRYRKRPASRVKRHPIRPVYGPCKAFDWRNKRRART